MASARLASARRPADTGVGPISALPPGASKAQAQSSRSACASCRRIASRARVDALRIDLVELLGDVGLGRQREQQLAKAASSAGWRSTLRIALDEQGGVRAASRPALVCRHAWTQARHASRWPASQRLNGSVSCASRQRAARRRCSRTPAITGAREAAQQRRHRLRRRRRRS